VRQILIRKGAKVRAVYCPEAGERRGYNRLARRLARAERRAAAAAGVAHVAHGFVVGRSPVTCAEAHVGAAVTVSVDLAGWYDSVTADQVAAGLVAAGLPSATARALAAAACRTASAPSPHADRLAPRQGLPSSPAAANLAAVAVDADVVAALDATGLRYVYTRYADDIIVSLWDDGRPAVDSVVSLLTRVVEGVGWRLSPNKTHVQRSRAGRRVVVGVSVGPDDVRPPRATSRRLRAASHSDPDSPRTAGLAEWCRLRRPRDCSVWADVAAILADDDDGAAVAIAADRLADAGIDDVSEWSRSHRCPEEAGRRLRREAERKSH